MINNRNFVVGFVPNMKSSDSFNFPNLRGSANLKTWVNTKIGAKNNPREGAAREHR
jgi:hypothetical protein